MKSKVEKYIQEHTNKCSNEDGFSYVPWLTPDDARAVAAIAREEVIERACEWLKNNVTEKGAFSVLSFKKEDIESFKQAMEKGE